jgi:hypothetical protein
VLLGVVDHGAVELLGQHVAQDADREVGLLEDQGGGLDLLGAALHHLVQLVQVVEVALEVALARALCRRAHDHAAVALVELLQQLALAVALVVRQPARGADAGAARHVDEVAPGDRQLHRKPRALRLQGVLDDLDEDLLLGLDQLVDPPALAVTAARHLLAVGKDDLVDVQETVPFETDVDEGGLHTGEDVVDDALVDVADDGPRAAALDVELRHLHAVLAAVLAVAAAATVAAAVVLLALASRALAFEYRDTGLPRVHGNENSLLQLDHLKAVGRPASR